MFGLGKRNATKLLEAAGAGNEGEVQEVLARHSDLVNTTATKGTARHHSSFEEGVTPMHLAARRGHKGTVELLRSHRAVTILVSANGATSLHFAASEGHHEIASLLLDHVADPDARDTSGRTPLHGAVSGGHQETVQLLLARGAHATIKDREGNAPLHEAAKVSSEPLAGMLIKAGANVNERNAQDRTPLHVAIVGAEHSPASQVDPNLHARREATAELVKLLLSRGADVNAVDNIGETALDLVTYLEGDVGTDLVELLRAQGGEWVRYRHQHPEAEPPAAADEEPASSDETIVGARPFGQEEAASEETDQERPTAQAEAPIPLGSEPILIGRIDECHVQYKSRTMSRRHARIEPTEDGYVITDLDSHNGTLIDDEPITAPPLLQPGEIIVLGAYDFEFDGKQLIPLHGELTKEELRRERQVR